jgi:hypothetical protein
LSAAVVGAPASFPVAFHATRVVPVVKGNGVIGAAAVVVLVVGKAEAVVAPTTSIEAQTTAADTTGRRTLLIQR